MATEVADDSYHGHPGWGLDSKAPQHVLAATPHELIVGEPRMSPTQRAFLEAVTRAMLSPSPHYLNYSEPLPEDATAAARLGYNLARSILTTSSVAFVRNRGPAYGAEQGQHL